MMSIENIGALTCVFDGVLCTILVLRYQRRKYRLLSMYGWGAAVKTEAFQELSNSQNRLKMFILMCYVSAFILHAISIYRYEGYVMSDILMFLVTTTTVITIFVLYSKKAVLDCTKRPIRCLYVGLSVILGTFFWIFPWVGVVVVAHLFVYGLLYCIIKRNN